MGEVRHWHWMSDEELGQEDPRKFALLCLEGFIVCLALFPRWSMAMSA